MTRLEEIDPALGAMREFGELNPEASGAIQKMRTSAIFTDGQLPAKHKALAAILWSVAMRCEPCVRFYAIEAKRLGATKRELGEMLGVAATMGGCVGETWAVKALHAYNDADGEASGGDPACCAPPEQDTQGAQR